MFCKLIELFVLQVEPEGAVIPRDIHHRHPHTSIRTFRLPPNALWYPPGSFYHGSDIMYSVTYSQIETEALEGIDFSELSHQKSEAAPQEGLTASPRGPDAPTANGSSLRRELEMGSGHSMYTSLPNLEQSGVALSYTHQVNNTAHSGDWTPPAESIGSQGEVLESSARLDQSTTTTSSVDMAMFVRSASPGRSVGEELQCSPVTPKDGQQPDPLGPPSAGDLSRVFNVLAETVCCCVVHELYLAVR